MADKEIFWTVTTLLLAHVILGHANEYDKFGQRKVDLTASYFFY